MTQNQKMTKAEIKDFMGKYLDLINVHEIFKNPQFIKETIKELNSTLDINMFLYKEAYKLGFSVDENLEGDQIKKDLEIRLKDAIDAYKELHGDILIEAFSDKDVNSAWDRLIYRLVTTDMEHKKKEVLNVD